MPFKFDREFFNFLSSNNNVTIIVQIGDPPSQEPVSIKLNLNYKLSDIRNVLENYNIMDNSLLFSQKIPKKNDYIFSKILYEQESNFYLSEIIETVDEKYNFLYLMNLLDWHTLNKSRQLDYGCTMAFDGIKIAEKRAFIINDCELIEIGAEGYKKGQLKFEKQNDWMEKTNLFFNVDANITNFVKLGLSAGNLQNKNFNDEIKSAYKYTELGKVSLKLNIENLKLSDEFKVDIENAIKSKDPEEFRKITEKYGQFIATKVILGGRVYFKDIEMLTENSTDRSKEGSVGIGAGPIDLRIGNNSNDSKRESNFYNFIQMRLLGGKHPVDKEFNEKMWIESLEHYQNWHRIELQEPVSIFQLLPNDLRKRTFESLGKKILYSEAIDYEYISNDSGKPGIVELSSIGVPKDISDILLNKEAECNIFATVVDTEESKNDFFTCQILLPQNGKPSLIVHCIQRDIKKRKYKLNIGIMIVGYDTNFDFTRSDFNVQLKVLNHKVNASSNQIFNMDLLDFGPSYIGIPVLSKSDSKNNSLVIGHHFYEQDENKIGACTFSYCLKNRHYVNLPEFTIYTLIVPHDKNHKYGTLPLKRNIWNRSTKSFQPLQPKYISLYSKEGRGPIFPKQKNDQIKIKYLKCCNKDCSICKNKKLSVKNIECKFFYPCIR
ncbi:hypothetical protein RirG_200690 [Rhizophagus irregularis DAOM 197198w]|uniref:Uncharacterized protein n=1 Tax=Rhizophagus irregularis (strain DAOM 197198w) TaxID=1432141 RepID=A0A015KEX9_RHIIW|nr:hypothetical protein RirG_200690 [Rhizophagus irregularis DAOM 197198w]